MGDDVAFGPLNLGLPADEVRRRVAEALGRVGMAGSEERVPLRLSGGEKRRVALAGVLAMRPEVLLLDEPSMFLDPRGRRELIALLNGLGGTKVIASHDLEFILRTCRRVLLLDGGKVVADGDAADGAGRRGADGGARAGGAVGATGDRMRAAGSATLQAGGGGASRQAG